MKVRSTTIVEITQTFGLRVGGVRYEERKEQEGSVDAEGDLGSSAMIEGDLVDSSERRYKSLMRTP